MEEVPRQSMDVDIVCVGFGPATGGFLTTLSRKLANEDGTPKLESQTMPGLPLQVLCYERADDIGYGVSGVVTKARAIRESFPDLDTGQIPTATNVKKEKLVYLLDPVGASRRTLSFRWADKLIGILPHKKHAFSIPYIPPFMNKHGGLVFSIGQFNQWVGSQLMGTGLVQLWPGTPADKPLIEDKKVSGIRLVDQGTDKKGNPDTNFMPGMDIRAALTVVGDGPIGPIGRQLDEHFGLPEEGEQRDWAVGMKMVVDLPESCTLEPGTVIHTLGFPEPEIFGFLYVYPEKTASLGIFVPSWFKNPVRSTYRYLQHWMLHPYLWQHLEGGQLRSWGAKTIGESGKKGEPHLVGDGYARIGEGSGSTNILSNSGVDEAWMTGVLLAEAVEELAKAKKPFTQDNLQATYVKRRRKSWIEKEAQIAKKSRDGFEKGVFQGMIGMALSGLTKGKLNLSPKLSEAEKKFPSLEEYYRSRISPEELNKLVEDSRAKEVALHDVLMTKAGWPEIPYDGKLLVSHQDALLMGGKVQAPAGYKDHVVFVYPQWCETCENKLCIEICSGEAITATQTGVPAFDREKCVHCGACLWSCTKPMDEKRSKTNIDFQAGTGGLHSAEN